MKHGMKKRILLSASAMCLALLLALTACGRGSAMPEGTSADPASGEAAKADGAKEVSPAESAGPAPSDSASPEKAQPTDGVGQTDTQAAASGGDAAPDKAGLAWPVEFKAWGIPTISGATLSFADNKSSTGDAMTSGVTATVIIDGLTRKQFDRYTEDLLSAGFDKAKDSIDVLLQVHEKTVPEGVIRLMLSHDEATTSIIASHSGAAAMKDAEALANAGKGPDTKDWPEVLKQLPPFPAGAYKEMLAMGDNFFTLTWLDVTKADWEAYTKTLEREGYEKTDLGDTTGYIKMDGKEVINVSGVLSGSTLQLIVATGTME